MQQVSLAVIDNLKSYGHEALAYIDDQAGAHATHQGTQDAFDRCSAVLRELGLVKADEKQQPPQYGHDLARREV